MLGYVLWLFLGVNGILLDLLFGAFKWHGAGYEVVEDDAEGPGVLPLIFYYLTKEQLWRLVT